MSENFELRQRLKNDRIVEHGKCLGGKELNLLFLVFCEIFHQLIYVFFEV